MKIADIAEHVDENALFPAVLVQLLGSTDENEDHKKRKDAPCCTLSRAVWGQICALSPPSAHAAESDLVFRDLVLDEIIAAHSMNVDNPGTPRSYLPQHVRAVQAGRLDERALFDGRPFEVSVCALYRVRFARAAAVRVVLEPATWRLLERHAHRRGAGLLVTPDMVAEAFAAIVTTYLGGLMFRHEPTDAVDWARAEAL